jgi:uncharacterized protein (DUF1697 family)
MPAEYLALLRGVNVGGKNKLPMKDLAGMFVALGCRDVRTFIQSGNIVFSAERRIASRVADLIAARIAEAFGYRTPVVLRTAEQLAEIVSGNPFLEAGSSESSLHVLFLKDMPSQSRIGLLDPDRSPPDTYLVRGQQIFLNCPNGVARTKLTNDYFDAKLATTTTGRNWRTVTKLLELMSI